jgi:hypothetical protein
MNQDKASARDGQFNRAFFLKAKGIKKLKTGQGENFQQKSYQLPSAHLRAYNQG